MCGLSGTTEVWLNRINMGQTSVTVVAGNVYSGNTVQVVASPLSSYTHIVFRAVTGVSRFLPINIHAFANPICSSSHVPSGDVLSDGRIKTERELVSGQQALDICSQINCYTYDRQDLKQRRVGCIADEVKAVMTAALPQVEISQGLQWPRRETWNATNSSRWTTAASQRFYVVRSGSSASRRRSSKPNRYRPGAKKK